MSAGGSSAVRPTHARTSSSVITARPTGSFLVSMGVMRARLRSLRVLRTDRVRLVAPGAAGENRAHLRERAALAGDLDEGSAGQVVRIVDQLRDRQHRRDAGIGTGELRDPVVAVARRESRSERGTDL